MADRSSNSVEVFFADKAKVLSELRHWAARLKDERRNVEKRADGTARISFGASFFFVGSC